MSSGRSRSGGSECRTPSTGSRGRSECTLRYRLVQIAIGGGDDAHVDADGARAAQAQELTLLEHAQELRLRRRRHLGDFVEEQDAAGGQFDLARLRLLRAGKGAALEAEQLGLEELLRQRRAIDRDERAAPRGERWWMNRAMTSLPVPDSPCRHVVASVAATCVARLITSRHAGDVPTGASAAGHRPSTGSAADLSLVGHTRRRPRACDGGGRGPRCRGERSLANLNRHASDFRRAPF